MNNTSILNSITSAVVKRDINNMWWEMKVFTNKVIDDHNMVYTSVDSGDDHVLFFGRNDEGIVHGLASSSNTNGYGGALFALTMTDGTVMTVKGPWSGRPAVYMEAGFPAHMEVVVDDTKYHNLIRGFDRELVDAIIAKFDLPYHTEIGPIYKNSQEDALILVPNKEGQLMDKVHWRVRLDINMGYWLNKLTFGRFSNQIKKWYDKKYPF